MKKILALLLVLAMALSLVACGSSKTEEPATANSADAIADEMTSSDGKYEVAFITDVGQLRTSPSTRAPMTA